MNSTFVAGFLAATAFCFIQNPEFEVASVRPARPGAPGIVGPLVGGRVEWNDVSLRFMIKTAWDLSDYQIAGGPDWFDTLRFDVSAKPGEFIPQTPEGSARQKLMVQAMLRDRFGLAWRRETRELPIYNLVVGKNGARLVVSATPDKHSFSTGRGRLRTSGTGTGEIAKLLSGIVGRAVVDRTGLSGPFDVSLNWSDDAETMEAPSLFTALQESLGLKLEPARGLVEMFVIERVHRPNEN